VLIREDLGEELVLATRILAHAAALGPRDRISALAGEVVYVNGGAASNATMTAHDIAAIWLLDGYMLRGEAPDSIERHLAAYRADDRIGSVAISGDVVTGPSIRETTLALIRRARPDLRRLSTKDAWDMLRSEAVAGGALVGL
jgi:hypothetical protein